MVDASRSGGAFSVLHGPNASFHVRGRRDEELLNVCADFDSVDAELNRIIQRDIDPPEAELVALHRRWLAACRRSAALRARTLEGQRAKAAMLLSAVRVAVGPDLGSADPHELLGKSLAQDLLDGEG